MPERESFGYLTPVTRIRHRSKAGRGLFVATVVSSALIIINSVLLIILATELQDQLPGPRALSIVSLVFQVLTAALLSWLAWRERRRRTGFAGIFNKTQGQRKRDVAVSASITGTGQILTLASLIWIRTDMQNPMFSIAQASFSVSTVLIISWILSLISETAIFWLTFPKRKPTIRERRRSRLLNTPTAQPFLSPSQHESPKFSLPSSNPFSSLNGTPAASPKANSVISLHSLTLPRAPARISASIRRSMSIASVSARATPSPRHSGESAFDTWDTSSVPSEMRQAMHPSLCARPNSARAHASRLPPIPGSRPVSPANALEGPFGLASSPHGDAASDAIARTEADIDSPLDTSIPIPADTAELPPSPTIQLQPDPLHALRSRASLSSLPAPPPLTQPHPLSSHASLDSLNSALSAAHAPPRPSFARKHSLTSHGSIESFHHLRSVPAHVPEGESQIHPLFRVTSPEPAPSATPGTVVTAAPMTLSDVPVGIVRASVERVRGARAGSLGQSRPGSRAASQPGSRHASGPVSPMIGSPLPSPNPVVWNFSQDSLPENSDEAVLTAKDKQMEHGNRDGHANEQSDTKQLED